MNIIKLQKITGASTDKLFNIPSYNNNAAYDTQSHARAVDNYDEDMISSMKDNITDAVEYLGKAESDIDEILCALEEWKALSEAMWETLSKEDQQTFLMKSSVTPEKWEVLQKAYNLENLKDL